MRIARQPGATLRVDVKRRRGRAERLQRLRYLNCGRQDLVVEGECRFDETGGAGGGLRVTELRFH